MAYKEYRCEGLVPTTNKFLLFIYRYSPRRVRRFLYLRGVFFKKCGRTLFSYDIVNNKIKAQNGEMVIKFQVQSMIVLCTKCGYIRRMNKKALLDSCESGGKHGIRKKSSKSNPENQGSGYIRNSNYQ